MEKKGKAKYDLRDLSKPVKAEDIEFRIQSATSKGWATVLAYKDARYDMNILDEVVGPENWQKDFVEIGGNLHCRVGIRCPNTGEWIWKQDVGTESNTEKTKGQASDAFKRACFNWGIGRELYSFPYIGFQLNDSEFSGGKARVYFNKWTITITRNEDDSLATLQFKDPNGATRFTHGVPVGKLGKQSQSAPKEKTLDDAKAELIASKSIDDLAVAWKTVQDWGFSDQVISLKDELKETFLKTNNMSRNLDDIAGAIKGSQPVESAWLKEPFVGRITIRSITYSEDVKKKDGNPYTGSPFFKFLVITAPVDGVAKKCELIFWRPKEGDSEEKSGVKLDKIKRFYDACQADNDKTGEEYLTSIIGKECQAVIQIRERIVTRAGHPPKILNEPTFWFAKRLEEELSIESDKLYDRLSDSEMTGFNVASDAYNKANPEEAKPNPIEEAKGGDDF